MKKYLKKLEEKRKLLSNKDDGFSLLELVVAVGILLILTVGGTLAYTMIKENTEKAATKSAVSDVFVAAVNYESDQEIGTDAQRAVDEWNGSTKQKDGKPIIEISITSEAGDPLTLTAVNHNLKNYSSSYSWDE